MVRAVPIRLIFGADKESRYQDKFLYAPQTTRFESIYS